MNDKSPNPASLDTATGAAQIFDEMRAIALGFMKRTEDVENQLNFIVATVYVNLKKRAKQGDTWAGEMVTWMDAEIAKLKDFRERYLVNIAGRSTRPVVVCPHPDCDCNVCQQRNVDEAAGINYKAGEY